MKRAMNSTTLPVIASLMLAFTAVGNLCWTVGKGLRARRSRPEPFGALKEALQLMQELKDENKRLRERIRELEKRDEEREERMRKMERRERRLLDLVAKLTHQPRELVEFQLNDDADDTPPTRRKRSSDDNT